jgi:DNA repair photolyase
MSECSCRRPPLVTRDIDLLKTCIGASVGFSIPTDDDRVRAVLEPRSPTISARLEALRRVHDAGIPTWVFIAPMLPMNPQRLAEQILPLITHALIDPLNYRGQVAGLFRRHGWDYALSDDYAARTGAQLAERLGAKARHA